MADPVHIRILRRGKKAWNRWRSACDDRPDLRDGRGIPKELRGFDLRNADLRSALIPDAQLRNADLTGADLSGCIGRFAVFSAAHLGCARLDHADLRCTSFRRADLRGASLNGAILRFASLVEARVEGASFREAEIYGISAWNLRGEPADQQDMVIQADRASLPTTVDDLDTAQLLFLLLDNPKIADVIDTASRRIVLLLGRFSRKYKPVLDAIKARLLERNLVPVLFDFKRPEGRDLTETVASLAHMAYFVVADLSGARSIPQELSFIIPHLPSVPVVPLLREGERSYAMFEHFRRYPWVKAPVRYRDLDHLLSIFDEQVWKVGVDGATAARGRGDR